MKNLLFFTHGALIFGISFNSPVQRNHPDGSLKIFAQISNPESGNTQKCQNNHLNFVNTVLKLLKLLITFSNFSNKKIIKIIPVITKSVQYFFKIMKYCTVHLKFFRLISEIFDCASKSHRFFLHFARAHTERACVVGKSELWVFSPSLLRLLRSAALLPIDVEEQATVARSLCVCMCLLASFARISIT